MENTNSSGADGGDFYWAESTGAAVVKAALIALNALLVAEAVALSVRLRASILRASIVAIAALGVSRVAIIALPNSLFDQQIHGHAPLAYALDSLPETLFFIAVWVLFASLVLFVRFANAASTDMNLPIASGTNRQLKARLGLQGQGQVELQNGLDSWKFRARASVVTAAVASLSLSIVAVVVVGIVLQSRRSDYEAGRLYMSIFRGAMGSVATIAFGVVAALYPESVAFSGACALVPLIKGLYGAFDFLIDNEDVRSRIGDDWNAVVWSLYFIVTEIAPLSALIAMLWSRNAARKRQVKVSGRSLLVSSHGALRTANYQSITSSPSSAGGSPAMPGSPVMQPPIV